MQDYRKTNACKSNEIYNEIKYYFRPSIWIPKTTSLVILDIYAKIVSSIENSGIACGIFLDFAISI